MRTSRSPDPPATDELMVSRESQPVNGGQPPIHIDRRLFHRLFLGVRLNQHQSWNSVVRSRGPCGGSRVIGQSCCTMAVFAIVRTVPPGRGPQPPASILSSAPATDFSSSSLDTVFSACGRLRRLHGAAARQKSAKPVPRPSIRSGHAPVFCLAVG